MLAIYYIPPAVTGEYHESMKTLLLWWLAIQPIYHYHDPDRPLWADRQDVFVTPIGIYYEYLIWPQEQELFIGYWRIPVCSIKTWKSFRQKQPPAPAN